MKRAWLVWTAFAASLAVLLAAVAWISLAVLRLDRAEMLARRQAELEENVRLALWRMDSQLAPLVGQESARPYFTYRAFVPVQRAYGRMFSVQAPGEALAPSPLLAGAAPYVLLHFQFDPEGRLSSPCVPTGRDRALAVPAYLSADALAAAQRRLDELARHVDRAKLLAQLPKSEPVPAPMIFAAPPVQNAPPLAQPSPQPTPQQDIAERQAAQGQMEFSQRKWSVGQNANLYSSQALNDISAFDRQPVGPTDVGGALMTPLWLDQRLLLARRVSVAGRQYVQGCLLDWPAIRAGLLGAVSDLLPEAELQPAAQEAAVEDGHRLAALPLRLVPGPLGPAAAGPPRRPLEMALAATWACVLLAATAVGVLVAGVMRLSRRRAAFVSAVTHELRTPLTTFQIYAEMLAEGMVPQPEQQHAYLETLRGEAARLIHLVENVLAYARLERGRTIGRIEPLRADALLERIKGHLAQRAARAEMQLVVECDEAARPIVLKANVPAVEQILMNLVDNACEYAGQAADRRIHLALRAAAKSVEAAIRDHGPGICRRDRRRLFRSFSKSAEEAARSAPGVGLGLALSRRLARDLGGDLWLDTAAGGGACFVLRLPRAEG